MNRFLKCIGVLLLVLLLKGNFNQAAAQVEKMVDTTLISLDTVIAGQGEVVDEEVQQEKADKPFVNTDKQVQVTPRRLPPGTIEKIKKEKKYWFADSAIVEKKKPGKYGTPFFMRDWVKILFWILVVIAFALTLAWYLSQNNIRLFRKKDIPVPDSVSEELPENLFDIDYAKALAKALSAGDHRLAVRLKFLGLLRQLSEKGLIQYRQDRTNMDYMFQLGSRSFYPEFFRVVRHYEYCWYGQFEVNAEIYQRIAADFENLEGKLN